MPQGVGRKSPGFGAADLMLIRGLDRVTAERLILQGLSGFAEMASWTASDVERLTDRLGLDRRISTGCWIEQAAVLAHGVDTWFAGRVRRGETAAIVRHPAPQAFGLLRPIPPLAVARAPGTKTSSPVAPPPASARPQRGSLMRRLGMSQPADDTPRGLPASFTGVVEEAIVEIVRRSRSNRDPARR